MDLDELTAALSQAKVGVSFTLIRTLPSFGAPVLIVERCARQALAISDCGYVMEPGKLALEAPAGDLLASDRAAELYLGWARTKSPSLEHAMSNESPT